MGIACLFGHKWNGCKCARCGETRDGGHEFQPVAGKCEEKCINCEKVRPLEHQWKGCQCERCGKQRDSGHDWDGLACRRCGKFMSCDDLKHELGRSVTKDQLIKKYKDCPELKRAELLRSALNDDELIAVLKDSSYEYRSAKYLLPTIHNARFISEYLVNHPATSVTGNIYSLVFDMLPLISTSELLEPFLFMNPMHGYAATCAIEKSCNPEALTALRNRLISLHGNIYQDEKSTHFLNRRPDPSDENLIILTGYRSGLQDIWQALNRKIKQFIPDDACETGYLDLFRK